VTGIKITDMTAQGSADGTEIIPASISGNPRTVTGANLKDYVIDSIEAIAAGSSVTGSDSVFILQGGALKPMDIDVVAQHAIDTIWGKAAETNPDNADVLALKDGGTTEKTVTLAYLAEYVRATIEAAILDISNLSDGSGALATSDKMLVTQGTTGKYVTVQNIYDAIYAGLAAYLAALSAIGSTSDADIFYVVRSGTGYKMTLAQIATHVAATLSLDGSGTAGYLADWSDANTLEATYTVVTSTTAFDTGSDTAVPTTAAVRQELDELINDQTEIGAALVGTDTFLVDDGANGTQKKSLMSRVWTYVNTLLVAVTDLSSYGWFLDEDTLVSDDDTKVPSQQSVKAYVDGYDWPITQLNIDAGTEIGGALADADLLIVDDGGAGTNRSALMSRVWTYAAAKLAAVTDLTGNGWIVDEDNMASDLATKVPTQQSVKAYADDLINYMTDIGAAIEGTDTFLVDDGAGGTQRKSTISRIKTYMETAGTYKTIWVPASQMVPSTTAGCATLATYEYATNDVNIQYLAFDGSAQDESAEFDLFMPEAWDRGTIRAKLAWVNGHADSNPSEYIGFYLYANAVTDNDAMDFAVGTPQLIADQAGADDTFRFSATSPAITVSGTPALGDMIHFRLKRDFDYTGGGTAMDVDCWVIGLLIQYQENLAVTAWT